MKKSYNFASSLESHFHVNMMSNFWNREADFYWSWLAIVVLSYSSAKKLAETRLEKAFPSTDSSCSGIPTCAVLCSTIVVWSAFPQLSNLVFPHTPYCQLPEHVSKHVNNGESVWKHQIFLISRWSHWKFSSFEKSLSANGDLKSDIFAWMTVRSLHDESKNTSHFSWKLNAAISVLLFRDETEMFFLLVSKPGISVL